MSAGTTSGGDNRECNNFYRRSMEVLQEARIPFLMGGAYAFGVYTGIHRNTKDFDVFLGAHDFERALKTLARAGFESEKTFPHWLGKVKSRECCIDLIYRAGNGLCEVDDSWFARARDAQAFGLSVKMCPPEELIWMKAFIMERERFDGADIAHLFESRAEDIDWTHLVNRFGLHWQVLLSHLILFAYIFPSERGRIPPNMVDQLVQRWRDERSDSSTGRVCRGTLLSREQYLPDIRERGFRDARLEGAQRLAPEDIAHWTNAIG
jgi:putative nucleotidyltransferase-like protein